MNKERYIQAYLQFFEYIFWIDDDAFFVDFERKVEPILPQGGSFLSACASPDNKTVKTVLNAGVLSLRRCDTSHSFLAKVLSAPFEEARRWWPDEAGLSTGGDQDLVVYLLLNDVEFKDRYELHHYSLFNSRLRDLLDGTHDVFVLHHAGSDDKLGDTATAAAHLGRSTTLIPEELEKQLRVSTIEPQERAIHRITRASIRRMGRIIRGS
jgi:hypothetical protein